MINIWAYSDAREIMITCVDGEKLEGTIVCLDDEEDSEMGESAICIETRDGRHIEIGESEIKSIEVLEQ